MYDRTVFCFPALSKPKAFSLFPVFKTARLKAILTAGIFLKNFSIKTLAF
jgi:hypothetical protein